MSWFIQSAVTMGSDNGSIRSFSGRTGSPRSAPLQPRFNTTMYQDSRHRPRSEFDYATAHSAAPLEIKPLRRSLPAESRLDESGPSSSGSRFRAPRPDFVQSAMHQIGPPPLAPYVPAAQRYHAPRPAARQWLGADGRRFVNEHKPAFPPPPEPAPAHIVASSQPSPTSFHYPSNQRERPDSAPFPHRPYSHSPERQSSPPVYSRGLPTTRLPPIEITPSPYISTSTRSSGSYFPPPLPTISPSARGEPLLIHHGEPLVRTRSHESTHSHHSYAMQRDLSGGSSISGSSYTGTSSLQSGQQYPLGSYKKKRTRALMTHMQQSGLTRLWRKNQRQKGRKTLAVNGGIPEGEDPADYEDLQKSPRSRRLSLEGDERISAWAGESSSTGSTRFLLDPPSATPSDYQEPLIHHPRHFPHPYQQDGQSSHDVVAYQGASPHGLERVDRSERRSEGKERAQDTYGLPSHYSRSVSHPSSQQSTYTQLPSPHSSSHSRSHPRHELTRPSAHPPSYPSSGRGRASSSRSDHTYQNAHSDRPFPSVLEPMRQQPHSAYPDLVTLPPIASPEFPSRPIALDSRLSDTFKPSGLKRRRTSPESIRPFYTHHEGGKGYDINPRFARARSHAGEDLGYEPKDGEVLRTESSPAIHRSTSHLPPELARFALPAPYVSERAEESGSFVLPKINSKSLSPQPQSQPSNERKSSTRIEPDSPSTTADGSSGLLLLTEMEEKRMQGASGLGTDDGSPNNKGKEKEENRQMKMPTSSSLRKLLD
uniref:Uncharacterized protein n=1 Tax=Kwoniella dejecticola CBS 10117 TaxID=1296121 RepID=A0A1A6AFE1_9TREE|nr:uncharacterized protein I303_00586 [Kwoniella dejecticola CBS 10117]OBR88769.1 hypothetical protein I303_00586 [Kwoniella dejecticola CBS 10117]